MIIFLVVSSLMAPTIAFSRLIQPADIVYKGAFRLPGPSGGSNWGWSGTAATFYPGGDRQGAKDGHPGSIYAVGHDWHFFVSEISIPRPVISRTKNPKKLPVARTLQPFTNIRRGVKLTGTTFFKAGLEYLPPQGQQKKGKLHFCFGFHLQFKRVTSHGWRDLNLSAGPSHGLWYIGRESPHYTNDYLFEIPRKWADKYVGKRRLATGRFRDGGLSGQGPTIYAIAPWQQGNPPPPGTTIEAVTLLKYSFAGGKTRMKGYSHADDWTGAAWLTRKGKSAVIFVGTKALGRTWYGYRNGTRHDACRPRCPDSLGPRGWWMTRTQVQIIFFDPADLAAVAFGKMKPDQPQPYAVLNIEPFMFRPKKHPNDRYLLGAMAYDRRRGYLYIFERRAEDDDKCIVHCFKIKGD